MTSRGKRVAASSLGVVALGALLWTGTHTYLSSSPLPVLVVVDTSYSMKPEFDRVEAWLDDFEAGSRYREIYVGSDKARLGKLDELRSKDLIFRTAFGRLAPENLEKVYQSVPDRYEKILLTNTPLELRGWEIVEF